MIQEFKDFINRGNVMATAVGLVMALYFQEVVNALLNGVIYPIIAAIFGKPSLGEIGFELGDSFVSIGMVIDALLMFVIVAFVLFLIVKAYNRAIPPKEEAAGPTETELLIEIRDELRRR